MKNSMKRMLSAVMAITMVAGATSVTAFAEDISDASTDKGTVSALNGTTFSAGNNDVEMPVISVSVPTSNVISIDPYNTLNKGQINSNDNVIINKSNVPMAVTIKEAKVTGTGVTIVEKAISDKTDTSKWANVSLAVTDGVNKTTSKVLGSDAQEIAVSTVMAPFGGVVKFNVTGTCALDPATAWTNTDKVNVTAAYKFSPQTYATYEVTKPTFWDTKAMSSGMTMTFDADTDDEADVLAKLPKTISNAGKELPVVWKVKNTDDGTIADEAYDGTLPGAGATTTVVACIPVGADMGINDADDTDIDESKATMYTENLASGASMPTIVISVPAASN